MAHTLMMLIRFDATARMLLIRRADVSFDDISLRHGFAFTDAIFDDITFSPLLLCFLILFFMPIFA